MILGIEKELAIFLQAILAGNLVCLIYNAIRVVRRIVKHNLFWISIEDLVYWIGVGIFLFLRIYQTSNGNIRWYFVIGVLIGGIITEYIIVKITKKYIAKSKKR